MKTLVVFGIITSTLLAATVLTTDNSAPAEETLNIQESSGMEIIKESGDEIFEYPSMEDAAIILEISEDSLVQLILFQEKTTGDEYKVK